MVDSQKAVSPERVILKQHLTELLLTKPMNRTRKQVVRLVTLLQNFPLFNIIVDNQDPNCEQMEQICKTLQIVTLNEGDIICEQGQIPSEQELSQPLPLNLQESMNTLQQQQETESMGESQLKLERLETTWTTQLLNKNACYVMVNGKAEVRMDGKLRTIVLEDQLFCELALIANDARSATVQTIQPCTLLVIPAETFKNYIQDILIAHMRRCAMFINSIQETKLSENKLTMLSTKCLMRSYKRGVQVTPDCNGRACEYIWFIKNGNVQILMKPFEGNDLEFYVRTMQSGDSFGEFCTVSNYIPRIMDFRAVTERQSEILRVKKDDFYTYVHPNKVKDYLADQIPNKAKVRALAMKNQEWMKFKDQVLPNLFNESTGEPTKHTRFQSSLERAKQQAQRPENYYKDKSSKSPEKYTLHLNKHAQMQKEIVSRAEMPLARVQISKGGANKNSSTGTIFDRNIDDLRDIDFVKEFTKFQQVQAQDEEMETHY